EAALAAGTMALAVTQGGRLGALAARHRAPLVTLPGGLPPRLALGYLFFPLLGILTGAGLPTPPPSEVAEALEAVETLAVEPGARRGPVAGGISEAGSRGEGRLARLLSLVYLGQWTSYYLALGRGVDPWAVPMLEEVKRRLRG